jgi:hypothetical protein
MLQVVSYVQVVLQSKKSKISLMSHPSACVFFVSNFTAQPEVTIVGFISPQTIETMCYFLATLLQYQPW